MKHHIPTLAIGAVPVEGSVRGQTRLTFAQPETSDDDGLGLRGVDPTEVPILAKRAIVVDGEVRGYTIFTKAGAETSDDQGRPPEDR